MNPAEFARAAAVGDHSGGQQTEQQQGTAWTDEGDRVVDATIHLGAGDRRKFKLGGTMQSDFVVLLPFYKSRQFPIVIDYAILG